MLNRHLKSYFTDTSKFDKLKVITTYLATRFMKIKPEIAQAEFRKSFESIANYDENKCEMFETNFGTKKNHISFNI